MGGFIPRRPTEVSNSLYTALRLIAPDKDCDGPIYRLKERANETADHQIFSTGSSTALQQSRLSKHTLITATVYLQANGKGLDQRVLR